ncbi:UNVERIFIED_CONTAM: hypothetical protein K2H54_067164 [Gekko kuhli]
MGEEEARSSPALRRERGDAGSHNMTSPDLDGLCSHVNAKISNIKTLLQLRKIGQEPSLKTVLGKILHEMFLFNDLLNKMELECHHQEAQQDQLKELQELIEKDYDEAQHLEENMPFYLPNAVPASTVGLPAKKDEQGKEPEPGHQKKPGKNIKHVKEIPFVTVEEFESVPA